MRIGSGSVADPVGRRHRRHGRGPGRSAPVADMKSARQPVVVGSGRGGKRRDRGDRSPADDGEPGDFDGRFGYLMTTPKPIIAAVNGAVAGMAYPFALSCDVRVLCPSSLFVTAFAQRGLIAEWGLGWLLPQLVGPSAALDLLFTSRRLGGEEAYRLGLGNYPGDRRRSVAVRAAAVRRTVGREHARRRRSQVMKRQVWTHTQRGLGVSRGRGTTVSWWRASAAPTSRRACGSFIEKRGPGVRVGVTD